MRNAPQNEHKNGKSYSLRRGNTRKHPRLRISASIITHRGRKGKELFLKILSHIFTTCRFSSNKKEFFLKKFLFPY